MTTPIDIKAWTAGLLKQAQTRAKATAQTNISNSQPLSVAIPPVSSSPDAGLPPYLGEAENRPGPRSTKSTRDEGKGVSTTILQSIAAATHTGQPPERIGIPRPDDDESTYIPPGMAVKQSLVRKELETGKDKLELAMGKSLSLAERSRLGKYRGEAESEAQRQRTMVPGLVLDMLAYAVKQYKELLEPRAAPTKWSPARIINRCLDDYIADLTLEMEGDDGWTDDDRRILSTPTGRARLTESESFKDYFRRWTSGVKGVVEIAGEKHRAAPPYIEKEIDKMGAGARTFWFRSVFNVAARVGTLDMHNDQRYRIRDRDGKMLTMAGALGLETSRDHDLTKVDAALILHDAGFRYYVDGKAGKSVSYIDWVRNEAQRLGRYKGQF